MRYKQVAILLVISTSVLVFFITDINKLISSYLLLTSNMLHELPKKDRPDLAALHNFRITKDPSLGYPPKERLAVAKSQIDNYFTKPARSRTIDNVKWTERGPDNVGGRTRAIMFDPNDDSQKKVWAGSVGGGLWYNNNITEQSSKWHVIDDLLPNLSISSIAYDPAYTDVFYFGTGEGWGNIDAIRGDGVWKSIDGGDSWDQLEAMNDGFNFFRR
ncbi:MAG: hypothetical protein OCD76_05980 [Reichenbachiella sp.]